MPRLSVYVGRETQQVMLLEQDAITIGRYSRATITLNNKLVSKLHAVIRKTSVGWEIEDQGSNNGTFVNGARITKPERLMHRDRVGIGKYELSFETPKALEKKATKGKDGKVDDLLVDETGVNLLALDRQPRGKPALAVDLGAVHDGATEHLPSAKILQIQTDLSRQRQAHLRSTDPGSSSFYPLDLRNQTLIGTSEDAHITVKGGIIARGICAVVMKEGDELVLKPRPFFAGVKVNGKRVKDHTLRQGDKVKIARSAFRFHERVH